MAMLNPSGDRAKGPSFPSLLSFFFLSTGVFVFIPVRRRNGKASGRAGGAWLAHSRPGVLSPGPWLKLYESSHLPLSSKGAL